MIRAIVTDIEGTTTDIRFVHDVLFPYARTHLPTYLQQHAMTPDIEQVLQLLRKEVDFADTDLSQLSTVFQQFIDQDRKSPALKLLQGMIWREGYQTGQFQGHLYSDVMPALRRWHQQGINLYLYSSGSVQAQQLLFGHSIEGDLTPLFSGYFDTGVGAKQQVTSYQTIAGQLRLPAEQLLFLSDIEQELEAANQAGWHCLQLVRGEATPSRHYPWVNTFQDIDLGEIIT